MNARFIGGSNPTRQDRQYACAMAYSGGRQSVTVAHYEERRPGGDWAYIGYDRVCDALARAGLARTDREFETLRAALKSGQVITADGNEYRWVAAR